MKTFRNIISAAALAVVGLTGFSNMAMADHGHDRGRNYDRHHAYRHDNDWRWRASRRPVVRYYPVNYYQPVFYHPQPVYYVPAYYSYPVTTFSFTIR